MQSPLGLDGKTVSATLSAAGWPGTLPASLLQAMREDMAAICKDDKESAFGISCVKSVLLARYLGNSSQNARRVMLCVWRHLRPQLIGCEAVVPRIWNT